MTAATTAGCPNNSSTVSLTSVTRVHSTGFRRLAAVQGRQLLRFGTIRCLPEVLPKPDPPLASKDRMTISERQREAVTAEVLVERAKAGDRMAFGELVRRYRGRILALTLHLTGSESEAEDVTQEVFIKAFRAIR